MGGKGLSQRIYISKRTDSIPLRLPNIWINLESPETLRILALFRTMDSGSDEQSELVLFFIIHYSSILNA